MTYANLVLEILNAHLDFEIAAIVWEQEHVGGGNPGSSGAEEQLVLHLEALGARVGALMCKSPQGI